MIVYNLRLDFVHQSVYVRMILDLRLDTSLILFVLSFFALDYLLELSLSCSAHLITRYTEVCAHR